MLCRQVLPDSDQGIEQIYIIKSEPGVDDDAPEHPLMLPEDVDQIKQEPNNVVEHLPQDPDAVPGFGMLDVIIKEEEPDVVKESSIKQHKKIRKRRKDVEASRPRKTVSKRRTKSLSHEDDEEEKFACPECNKKLSTQFNLERHMILHEKNRTKLEVIKRFVCLYCPKKFSTLFNLQRHEESHEIPPEQQVHKTTLSCYVCSQEFPTVDRLNAHLCDHANLLPYDCNECDKPIHIKSVRVLNKHLELHKETKTGSIKCLHCPARFHSLRGCLAHEKSHLDESQIREVEVRARQESKRLNVKVIVVEGARRYQCDFCEKSYSLLATLRKHTNSHTMEKIYPCGTCGKVFDRASSLTLHESVHSDFEPYKCQICGKGFKAIIRLILHRRIHTGERPFECHCGMAFRKKHVFMEHKEGCNFPKDVLSSNCRFCRQEPFSSWSDMISHVREFHMVMPESRCQFCTAKFKNAVSLVIHEYRHKLPNVIRCQQCNRIFKDGSLLEKHVLVVHSSVPQTFMCDVCGKTFNRSVCLRNHRQIHSGKRPHKCDLCPLSFLVPRNMRRHRESHFNAKSKYYIPSQPPDPARELDGRDDDEHA